MGLYGICIHMAQLELGFVGCLSGKIIDERVVYRIKSPFRHLSSAQNLFSGGCWTLEEDLSRILKQRLCSPALYVYEFYTFLVMRPLLCKVIAAFSWKITRECE